MFLGIVTTLLGLAPAGTALLAALLRAALGRPPGRLPLATLLGGGLPARGTSLGRHGSNDGRLRMQDKSENCTTGRHQTQQTNSKGIANSLQSLGKQHIRIIEAIRNSTERNTSPMNTM